MALALCLFVFQSARATVTLPFYDGFNYPAGTKLGAESPVVWDIGNSTGTGSPTCQSYVSLSYSGLPASVGNGVEMTGSPTSSRERGVNTASLPMTGNGETAYASFLINVQTLPTAQRLIAYFDDNGAAGTPVAGLYLNADGTLALSRSSTTPSVTNSTPLTTGSTYFVVLGYQSVSGTKNDIVSLWINPTLGAGQPGATAATPAGGVSDAATIQGFFLSEKSGVTGTIYIDEVRLGTTWADVTPSSGSCDAAAVTSDPSSTTVDAGQTANFTVTATGTSPTYQWQYSPDSDANWYPIYSGTGYDTASYTTTATDASQSGYQYRCVVSVSCDSSTATSAAATLMVNCTTAGITADPGNASVDAGQTANFTVTATGSNPTYQWEYSPDSGANWYPVYSGTGYDTASYTTAPTDASQSGYQYHCVVSVACDSSTATSAAATLMVNCSTADIISSPMNRAVPAGSTATFMVTATGSTPTYQWEISTDNGANWSPIGTSTNVYTTPATSATDNGNQYRCTVSVACDSSVKVSDVATLTVATPGATSFRSVAGGNWGDTTIWQLSVNNGASWVTAGAVPTSANCTNVLISSGTSVTNATSRTVDQVVVAAGGTLVVTNTLTVAATSAVDLDVLGTLLVVGSSSALTIQSGVGMVVESGGIFAHDGTSSTCVNNSGTITIASGGKFQLRRASGTIPTVTWSPGSTCEIAYSTASTSKPNATGLAQTFQNFLWNNPLQSASIDLGGALTNINGNFVLASSGGQEVKWSGDANFGGNITINDGSLNISGNSTPHTWTLNGDLMIGAGGTFNLSATASAQSVLIISGSGTQNYTCNGVNSASKLSWTVNPGSTLNLNSDLPMNISGRTLTANGTVNLNGHTLLTDLLAGSGTVRNEGGGNGLLVIGAANGTNTLDGSLALVDGASGTLGIVKGGNSGSSGLLTITAPYNYSGGLTMSNGLCFVNNSSGSGTGSGQVTVLAGTLGGSGIISGSVMIESNGNLAPGDSIGDLSINGNLTLNGNVVVQVNTGATPNTDRILGLNSVNYGGDLIISNTGAALTTSDTFKLFDASAGYNLSFAGINPANPDNNAALAWDTSTLNTDGILRISNASVAQPMLNMSQSGGTLTFSWTGSSFKLQSRTNLTSGSWSDYPGGSASPVDVIADPTKPSLFFRLSQ